MSWVRYHPSVFSKPKRLLKMMMPPPLPAPLPLLPRLRPCIHIQGAAITTTAAVITGRVCYIRIQKPWDVSHHPAYQAGPSNRHRDRKTLSHLIAGVPVAVLGPIHQPQPLEQHNEGRRSGSGGYPAWHYPHHHLHRITGTGTRALSTSSPSPSPASPSTTTPSTTHHFHTTATAKMAHLKETYPQEWTITTPYLNLHALLGEGPYHEPATNTLRFVDIINHRLHTVNLTQGPSSLQTIQLDTPVTVTADIEGVDPAEKLLVGLKYGLAVLDRQTGEYEYLSSGKYGGGEGEGDVERTRGNDGEVDPHGRFWVGTMTDFGRGDFVDEGSLYTFDLSKSTRQIVRSKLTIPNSIGWSPDSKTIYFTHTTAKQVIAWDYNLATGGLSNERVFYAHQGPGSPDGFRVDKDGNLWHAVYGEGRVLKISPEGTVIGQIKLPTSNITCCEFVGTELFITTAADGAEGEENLKYAGGLFRVDVGTTGLGHGRVKLGGCCC